MPLVFRDTKGAPLTSAEGDENIRFLRALIQAIEDNPPTANSIANVVVAGSVFSIFLQDGTQFGPFQLPVARISWRGEWVAGEFYFENDIVTVDGTSIYWVLEAHLAGDEFDSGALDGSDNPLYYQIFGPLEATMSTVGTISTDTYTLQLSDIGKYLRCTHVDGCVVTLLPGFSVGDEWHFAQRSLNPVIFVASGVTINPYDGHMNRSGGRGRVVTIKAVGGETFDIFGGLQEGEDEYY